MDNYRIPRQSWFRNWSFIIFAIWESSLTAVIFFVFYGINQFNLIISNDLNLTSIKHTLMSWFDAPLHLCFTLKSWFDAPLHPYSTCSLFSVWSLLIWYKQVNKQLKTYTYACPWRLNVQVIHYILIIDVKCCNYFIFPCWC